MGAEQRSISRREALALGAAAAVGVVAAPRGARAAACAVRGPALRKALKYGMIAPGATVLEKFHVAKRCGFEGIELDSPGGPPPAEVLEARERTGVEVPGVVDSVHWNQTLGDPDAGVRAAGLGALRTAIRDCHAYGGGSVLLVPAVVRQEIAYGDAYKRSQEEIRRVVPLAEELGIKIAFENVWNNFLLSPVEAARYVDEFGSAAVGFHFDVGNIVLYGWPEHWIRTLGPRILRLDIKEYSRQKLDAEGRWKGFDVEIGEGDCGWDRVMQALRDIGYNGWAAAEVAGGDEARLSDIARRMDRVFAM
ncbi:MAG TPA: sugar phosphate isomerase/epimerase family protein [Phycisphaerales bacterium]|nr:sugar phosphate isomerase/epimerase family protein [Phycisphaerales bacterium]